MLPKGKKEFSLIVKTEYDYRYQSDQRDKIIKFLQCLYAMNTGRNLPIYDIPEASLKNYTTTERDTKRKTNKNPPPDFINPAEDLLPE